MKTLQKNSKTHKHTLIFKHIKHTQENANKTNQIKKSDQHRETNKKNRK